MVNNVMSELGSANETVGSAASIEFNSFIEAIEPCVKEAQTDGDLTLSVLIQKHSQNYFIQHFMAP